MPKIEFNLTVQAALKPTENAFRPLASGQDPLVSGPINIERFSRFFDAIREYATKPNHAISERRYRRREREIDKQFVEKVVELIPELKSKDPLVLESFGVRPGVADTNLKTVKRLLADRDMSYEEKELRCIRAKYAIIRKIQMESDSVEEYSTAVEEIYAIFMGIAAPGRKAHESFRNSGDYKEEDFYDKTTGFNFQCFEDLALNVIFHVMMDTSEFDLDAFERMVLGYLSSSINGLADAGTIRGQALWDGSIQTENIRSPSDICTDGVFGQNCARRLTDLMTGTPEKVQTAERWFRTIGIQIHLEEP